MINKLKNNKLGALTTDKVTPDKINEIIDNMLIIEKFNFNSTQIKTLSSIPLVLVNTPGPGKAIKAVEATIKYNYNTTAFDGSNVVWIKASSLSTGSSSNMQLTANAIIGQSANVFANFHYRNPSSASATDVTTIVENDSLVLSTNGDATVGDGNITVYLTYKIIKL